MYIFVSDSFFSKRFLVGDREGLSIKFLRNDPPLKVLREVENHRIRVANIYLIFLLWWSFEVSSNVRSFVSLRWEKKMFLLGFYNTRSKSVDIKSMDTKANPRANQKEKIKCSNELMNFNFFPTSLKSKYVKNSQKVLLSICFTMNWSLFYLDYNFIVLYKSNLKTLDSIDDFSLTFVFYFTILFETLII